MPFSTFRFPDFQSLIPPNNPLGWIVLLVLAIWLIWIAWKESPDWRAWERNQWITFGALFVASFLVPTLIVFRLPIEEALPIPGIAAPAFGPLSPLLLAAPWMIATAIFGRSTGIRLALIPGFLMALWDTRNPFTPIEFGIMAAAFSWMLHQSYRTRIFTVLRMPWVAGIVLAISYPILYFVTSVLWLGADFSQALDFAASRLYWATLANSAPLLIGGFLLAAIEFRFPEIFPRKSNLKPSPAERNLLARVYSALLPIAVLLFLSLALVTWIVAGRASRQSLYSQLSESVEIAASGVPFMLETGQNQILNIANDEMLRVTNASQLSAFLAEELQQLPFFEQLVLVDQNFNTIAAYPVSDFQGIQPTESEIDAINRAFGGVPVQSLSIPPFSTSNRGAQLSYIAAVFEGSVTRSVLIGRSQIDSNPFAQAIILSLDDYLEEGASGILLDGDGKIVFHSRGKNILGSIGEKPLEGISEGLDADGSRIVLAYQPAVGSNWSALVQVPGSVPQQLALDIALPQLLLLLLLGGLTFVLLKLSLNRVSRSVDDLVMESKRFNLGKKSRVENSGGSDEISRLGSAIGEMQKSMQKNLDESQRLQLIAEEVAKNNDIHHQLELILESALNKGAASARIILNENSVGQIKEFAKGPRSKEYRNLDTQIMELCGSQKRVLLTNPARTPLKFGKSRVPEAISIFALSNGSKVFGHLWMLYEKPQSFEREEILFMEKLANHASIAISKAQQTTRLQDEIARSERILMNSVDPVLLVDQNENLLLINGAAEDVLSLKANDILGKKLAKIPAFSSLEIPVEEQNIDIQLPNGRNFEVQIINLKRNASFLGRALVMRDSTQKKQAEALRSEFLATVSHELQDPIELMRGYLTMLDMMGDLNEKQSAYTTKIAESVDNMSNLVNSLMDLERIESELGLQIGKISAHKIAEEVLLEIKPRAKQKLINLELSLENSEGSMIEADQTLLQRALYNLVDNAVRHSPRNESVSLSVVENKDQVQFIVKDNGAGIAPVDIPHVFARLRHSGAKSSSQRSGLGLSIVKSIVERHGGRVWAESQLGKGSSFIMEIPKTGLKNL